MNTAKQRSFVDLEAWRAECKKMGCRVKLVTRSKDNDYYQAVIKGRGVVGYFNTGMGGGKLNEP